ncbi:hypothetical protein NG819_15150 [Pseudarthrobacter sp. Fe7]|nr:hypothetical protein NG819_15150 [Pseudarthrobacter sp. Fe7]
MSTCTALIIPADLAEPARVETIDTGLDYLRTLVIEANYADTLGASIVGSRLPSFWVSSCCRG